MIYCLILGHFNQTFQKTENEFRKMYGLNSNSYMERDNVGFRYININDKPVTFEDLFNTYHDANNSEKLDMYESFSFTVAYLVNYLRQNGLTCDFVDKPNEFTLKEKLKQDIKNIIITTTFYFYSNPLIELITQIRKINNEANIIIGGPYIFNMFLSMEYNIDIIKMKTKSIQADYFIVSNEGEKTLFKLITKIKNKEDLKLIPNLYYKKSDQEYILTHVEQENNDINSFSINWNEFKNQEIVSINYRISKSCPFHCSYCNFPKYGGKYQTKDTEMIISELNQLNEIKSLKGIYFVDDSFNFPLERIKNLLITFIKQNYKFKWHTYIRCINVDEELVKLMKESNCTMVFIGVESGNSQILKNMKKSENLKSLSNAINLFNKYGIFTVASFIIGFPGETEKTTIETLSFIEENAPTFYRPRLWFADASTPIYNLKDQFNIRGSGYKWSHNTMSSSTARKIVDDSVCSIKNSIFNPNYPIQFHMQIRGIDDNSIKTCLNKFNYCMRDRLKRKENNENNSALIDNIKKLK